MAKKLNTAQKKFQRAFNILMITKFVIVTLALAGIVYWYYML